jgi:hypothetical protein
MVAGEMIRMESTFLFTAMAPRKAATCTVFPSPISSPTMPPAPCVCSSHIQRTPVRWYSKRRSFR